MADAMAGSHSVLQQRLRSVSQESDELMMYAASPKAGVKRREGSRMWRGGTGEVTDRRGAAYTFNLQTSKEKEAMRLIIKKRGFEL